MIVRDSIANFIGGISQQAEKLIMPHQSKVLENQLPDIIEGLKRRPPTEHITRLCNKFTLQPFIHTIIKEDGEYIVILDGSTCKVYDLAGNEKELYISTKANAYIQSLSPLTELDCVTLADYTFILNKKKQVKYTSSKYGNSYPNSAIVFVKQGNYSTDYTIKVNGVVVASLTTSDTEANSIKTTAIATSLASSLSSNLGANYTVTQQGSTILITNSTSTAFTINCEDSNGNRNLLGFYKTADTSTDLPIVAPNNFILNITQNAKDGVDDYFVKFSTADGSSFGQGVWSECPSPNVYYKLDDSTMPMALVRQSDGGFNLDVIEWGERLSGDEDTAPSPSFIGNTIQEINTYKGRLGFISGDKIVYSDVNDIFSFFKKTVLTELDTDPIDIASNSKMVLLKHTLPFAQELLLTSDTAQFILKGGDTFSNSTVSLDLATSYQCSEVCKPISVGSNGYFVYENGAYTRVMSLFVTESLTIDAEDITEQCPSYIPSNVYKIAGSAANNIMVALSTSERNNLYVYNFYIKNGQRVQSAWHKWIFEGKILNADFNKHLLYLTMQYEDGVYLEVVNFTPKLKDNMLDFLLYLDRKKTIYELTQGEGNYYFNLPYEIENESNFKVINEKGFEVSYTIDDGKCYINKNLEKVTIGFTYLSKWQMPVIYVRSSTNEGASKVSEGLLMIRDVNLVYAESGHFVVKVIPKYSTQIASNFKFTGKLLGLSSATIGTTSTESGTFLIPIISKNEDYNFVVENNSYLPSCYLSLDWIGDFVRRGESRR